MHALTRNRMNPWITRNLPHTGIAVGPCAWSVRLTLQPETAHHLRDHPSLIVVGLDDLAASTSPLPGHAIEALAALPIAIHLREPEFIRHLPQQLERLLAAVGRTHADAVILHVEELADIKSGSAIQALSKLRDQGKLRHIGLAAPTALDAEWLAGMSSARLLAVPFGLDDQGVRYRAMGQFEEFSMDAIAGTPVELDGTPEGEFAARFALAAAGIVLPVFASVLPPAITKLSDAEATAAWETYAATHPAPPPLPRSRPPE